jgi:histidinol-phosphate/aromatic aminotransferase/cobyric acid decarboxylase-like protein
MRWPQAVGQHPQLFVVSDEIYEYIVFDGEPVSFATLPGMKARTVTINGFSKAFAMTGWRLGYGAAPEPVARAMSKVQGTFTAGANAFVQQAGIAALQGGRAEVETMRNTYRRRRDETVRRLGAIAGLRFASRPVPSMSFPTCRRSSGAWPAITASTRSMTCATGCWRSIWCRRCPEPRLATTAASGCRLPPAAAIWPRGSTGWRGARKPQSVGRVSDVAITAPPAAYAA